MLPGLSPSSTAKASFHFCMLSWNHGKELSCKHMKNDVERRIGGQKCADSCVLACRDSDERLK